MLLPLPPGSVRKMSLQIHLALAACRKDGCGNSYQFNELLRILYITHLLQEMGFGKLPLEDYARAELGLSAALSHQKPSDAGLSMRRLQRYSSGFFNCTINSWPPSGCAI